MKRTKLLQDAKQVLLSNDTGEGWTKPTGNGLYPHQWLWDSFFIAIGQRHYDIERAKAEVRSPFRAQWKNGMLPHIIFGDAEGYHAGPEMWQSSVSSPDAPRDIETSGITQPPMGAEATVRIGTMLPVHERKEWYREMYSRLLSFHMWLYRERAASIPGLVVLLHPWESGMDNSPPWMVMMHRYGLTLRVKFFKMLHAGGLLEYFRRDTAIVPASERISTLDLHAVYALIHELREAGYDYQKLEKAYPLRMVDVTYNAILMRANQHLAAMAAEIGETLPTVITEAIAAAPAALEKLWDEETGYYYDYDDNRGELIRIPSITAFMPLYASVLPRSHSARLVRELHNDKTFGGAYPIPSAPLSSPHFKPHCYWQGPTWEDMNWLIADGLQRNGDREEAQRIRRSSLEMVAKGGMYEYFSPLDASRAGAGEFSWTAALTIDLLCDPQYGFGDTSDIT